ncbi:protein CHUP1, chloroplastic [Brassica napus]|uniref:Protein CHUP1, chloroplastic n=1 Tax=Brassica oleracea var. oleracea TaxID=109376 RepID=A0A0D3BRG3_BRAOL|nr:PREDICTED: protein CHUP1, chloroplastic [Brassica oleracea var. oleracea]XP_013710246.2 protein CHUP1, chloroplastic [Brassica napus]
MDGSGPREGGGAMKPVILKVGVALVLSATGLFLARFVSRKEENEVTSSARNQESTSSSSRRNDGEQEEETEIRGDHQQQQEILGLRSRLEELQRKEYEMELRFERYCNMKEQEVMLMEHKSMLSLEKTQLDFLRRELSGMEEEYKRGQDLVIVFLKLVGEIQELRSENWFLEGRAKKLRRRGKQLYRVLKEKSMRSTSVEKELLKCLDELEMKNSVVKELEGEVKDLKARVDVLQEEKEEVSLKSSEMVNVEDYKKVLEEYEDLKKDHANGVSEVINLRWSNACLRHKVMRNETNYEEVTFSPNRNLQEYLEMEEQADALALTVVADHEHHEETNHNDDHHHETSRRKRLMKKLKRWVEGNEKGRSTKLEERCFGRHSLTVEPEDEQMFHSRRSCSSV